VKGFGPFIVEESITELFRQFAAVQSVYLVRDRQTGISRGLAIVEFHTTEHAIHTLQQSSQGQLHLDSSPLKISFAKESSRQIQINLVRNISEMKILKNHHSRKPIISCRLFLTLN
jgi:RNA recognition motif-containing protein